MDSAWKVWGRLGLVGMLWTACGDVEPQAPGGGAVSADGSGADASTSDGVAAGADSAGTTADGLGSDGGDGAATPDTAAADAAPEDAALQDAGPEDAIPVDAALVDAAPVDAGTGADAAAADGLAPDLADAVPAPDTQAADVPAPDAAGCQPTAPATEACDGKDNDCDGETDEDTAACEDGNACTTDACQGAAGCSHPPASGPCDDQNACTTGDLCGDGACKTTAKVCDDGDVCTADTCDPTSGACGASSPKPCADGNPCTDDTCDKVKGCQATANTAGCDDGSLCTQGDTCKDATCGAGAAVSCDDGNPCTDDACDAAKGCQHVSNTAGCDDGQACTTDTCAAGSCKGTAKVCDDKDLCTTDSCDPLSGTCAHALIAGCKSCTGSADCGDGDDCTTDACVATKCQNSKIAGCYGPTDYVVEAVVLQTPQIALNTQVKWTATVKNGGKKPTGAAVSAWLSADGTVGGDDYKLHSDTSSGGALGIGATTPVKTLTYGAYVNALNLSAAHAHFCVQVTFSGATDPTPADNTKCVPMTAQMPDWQVAQVKPAKAPWFWNAGPYATVLTVKNGGNAVPASGSEAKLVLVASPDDKWDSTDYLIGEVASAGSLAPGASKDFTVSAAIGLGTISAGKFLCARAAANYAMKEGNLADNVLCVPHDVLAAGDIQLAPVVVPNQPTSPPTEPPGFWVGSWTQTGQYGVTPACRINHLPNVGEAAMKDYAVRCWIQTGTAGSANPTKLWEVKGTGATSLPPKPTSAVPFLMPNATFGGLADGTVKPSPAVGGKPQPTPMTMCMAFNEDGAVVEKNLGNNQVCATVQVTAVDLGWQEATGPTPPATSPIKAGTSAKIGKTAIKNYGSAKSKGGTAPPTYARLVLSQDAAFSADDVLLFSSTPLSALEPGAGSYLSSVAPYTDVGFTIPAGTAPGAYFLVFKLDATDAEVESTEGNNVWSVAITVN